MKKIKEFQSFFDLLLGRGQFFVMTHQMPIFSLALFFNLVFASCRGLLAGGYEGLALRHAALLPRCHLGSRCFWNSIIGQGFEIRSFGEQDRATATGLGEAWERAGFVS